MNFDLADKLTRLLEQKQLESAIALAETELSKIPRTDFHKMIGISITNQSNELKDYIERFDRETTKVLNSNRSFFGKLLNNESKKPAAYYCEMNGFTINYDKWFIDLFSFNKIESNNWEWLCEFYDSSSKDLTIYGLEEIQKVFEDVHENKRFDEPNIKSAYEVCELIVILRLQELFKETYKNEKNEWSKIPMYITAHDYEMIYKVN
jgi:hypothetical protein